MDFSQPELDALISNLKLKYKGTMRFRKNAYSICGCTIPTTECKWQQVLTISQRPPKGARYDTEDTEFWLEGYYDAVNCTNYIVQDNLPDWAKQHPTLPRWIISIHDQFLHSKVYDIIDRIIDYNK